MGRFHSRVGRLSWPQRPLPPGTPASSSTPGSPAQGSRAGERSAHKIGLRHQQGLWLSETEAAEVADLPLKGPVTDLFSDGLARPELQRRGTRAARDKPSCPASARGLEGWPSPRRKCRQHRLFLRQAPSTPSGASRRPVFELHHPG